MNQKSRAFAVTAALLVASFAAGPSVAQKQGGILKIYMLLSRGCFAVHAGRATALPTHLALWQRALNITALLLS
jgi:hypothetical protein